MTPNTPRNHAEMTPEMKEEAAQKLGRLIEARLGFPAGRMKLGLLGVPGMPTKTALDVNADPPLSAEEETQVRALLVVLNDHLGGSPLIKAPAGFKALD